MSERLLLVDTATPAGSVAVCQGEKLLGEIVLSGPANHTDHLLGTIDELLRGAGLALDDMDGFAVVLGPGSFTGLRVGVATVKGLALAAGKPVVGVSSLAALAWRLPFAALPVCPLLDARKGEVYAALYQWTGEGFSPLLLPCVLPPERWLERLANDVLFIGDGAQCYRGIIEERLGGRAHFAPWPAHACRASNGLAPALDMLRRGEHIPLEGLIPAYIRPSEAELAEAGRHRG
ncbi:MAG: tRNA (adenosine(37)-N6)-threonylcarbamoyltransferase complex dimerization subunit type 1 TsaB [Trichloromonas sp.]|jgi:tRNA threonylcarbamoyladenosine biosynthesis protein TsaB|nr:tRNA (adenosine(37)-N6)-threonylcarbamoyltransferase complex dimerization subunit type 1 TsaB [Trichloromonas sp.]